MDARGGGGQRSVLDQVLSANNERFARMRQLVYRQRQEHAREMQKLRDEQSQPPAELAENSDGIRLTVDLPGVLAQDLQVAVDQGVLSIEASRKTKSMDDASTVVKHQTIKRRYAINTDVVDSDKIEARLAHGVLTVTAPKMKREPRPQHQTVQVQTDSDQEGRLQGDEATSEEGDVEEEHRGKGEARGGKSATGGDPICVVAKRAAAKLPPSPPSPSASADGQRPPDRATASVSPTHSNTNSDDVTVVTRHSTRSATAARAAALIDSASASSSDIDAAKSLASLTSSSSTTTTTTTTTSVERGEAGTYHHARKRRRN